MDTVSQYISIDFAEVSAGLHHIKDQWWHLDVYPTACLFLFPLLRLLTIWCYQTMCISAVFTFLSFSWCPFPWLWQNDCLSCDYLWFMNHHWKRGQKGRNPAVSSLTPTSGRRQPGAGQTLSPAQHLEKAAEAEMERSWWYPLCSSWSFPRYALFQPLLPSLFLWLPISLVALKKDEYEHQEEARQLFAFLLPPLCFLGSAISSTLTSPIRAGWPLFAAGAAPFLASAVSPMQCSSIYHSASGRLKKWKKGKPSPHIIKEKLTLIWGTDKSIFIFHYWNASMPMCVVLAEPGKRGPSRTPGVSPAGLEWPSLRTRLEGAWQLLLLNDLMVVICTLAAACTLLACGKRELNQVMLNLRRKWHKLSTFQLTLPREEEHMHIPTYLGSAEVL